MDATEAVSDQPRWGGGWVVRRSASHEPCVQAAGYGRVVRALDDGPAVGKERHLVRIAPELEHKSVMLHRAVGDQPGGHLGKVYRTRALMDLHRVSPAQRDLRAAFAGEVGKLPPATGLAPRTRLVRGDLRMFVPPDVE